MRTKTSIPYEEKELEDSRKAISELSPEIIEKVKEIPLDQLRKFVLYTLARTKELYHVSDEDKALCFILKNALEAFDENLDCEC